MNRTIKQQKEGGGGDICFSLLKQHTPSSDCFPDMEDFIPQTIGKRTCISATSDGNCIFNSFSIALYGNEDESFFLRLVSVALIADNILQYSKYVSIIFKCSTGGGSENKWRSILPR
jgi:hypothetical protein